MSFSASFFDTLVSNHPSRTVSPDVREYLESILADESLVSDPAGLREATEGFLADAGMEEEEMNAFYEALAGGIQGQAEQEIVTGLKKLSVEDREKANRGTAVPTAVPVAAPAHAPASTDPAIPINPKAKRREKKPAATAAADPSLISEPELVATSQQSRFHLETVEAFSTEIDLKSVAVTIGDRELLSNAHLRLKTGVKYGLVGKNGVGKSTLLRVMGNNILVGLPQNVRILHIEQLEDYENTRSILDTVLSADKEREKTIKEAEALQSVLNLPSSDLAAAAATDPNNPALTAVVHSLLVTRARDRYVAATRLAIKRSGARGWDARAEQLRLEIELRDIEQADPASVATPRVINEVLSEVFERLGMLDVDTAKAKAQKILKGLGFSLEQQQKPVQVFSGGWRMRVALAQALLLEPDVLLLDEPTNHLDLPAILWLQQYLNNDAPVNQTLVIVSHDRDFLDAVTEETIVYQNLELKYYAGNFSEYEKNTDELRKKKERLYEAIERRRKHIQASIQKNLQQAKATGDDKRLGMVASRKKRLDRLGMEKTEDGKKFKKNNRTGYYLKGGYREAVVLDRPDKAIDLKIPSPEALRYHGPILQLSHVTFKYPGTETPLISDLSLEVTPHSRIAFLGPNGCGKSTLISLMAGTLQPTSGEIHRHHRMRIGYFAQHHVDGLDLSVSALQYMTKLFPGTREQDCRSHLGSFGITGDFATRRISALSGGQKSRVALAMVVFEAPHVLLLDEITNHLDMNTIEALVVALSEYEGACVFVSHDIWFMRQVVGGEWGKETEDEDERTEEDKEEDEEAKGKFYVVGDGKIEKWEKDFGDYVDKVLESIY